MTAKMTNRTSNRKLRDAELARWVRKHAVCPAGCDPYPIPQGHELICSECWFMNRERSVMRMT